MRRLLRGALVGLGLLGLLAAWAKWSGRAEPRDAVATAHQQLGIELRAGMIPTNGIRLHVVQAGPADGPPVLLLHGYPEFWWGWKAQVGRLAQAGFRVIAPDQRGYDLSDKPGGVEAYTIPTLVDDALGLLATLGVQQVFLAGHDWGGAIAWRIAIDHPEKVRRLAMFNAPHPGAWMAARADPGKEESISWFRTFFLLPGLPEILMPAGNWAMVVKNLRDTSRPGTFTDEDWAQYRSAWARPGAMHAMVNWYRAAARYPPPPGVAIDGTVHVPTRIVWGLQDRFFEPRLARLTQERCADATLVELPTAGHWLLHEEPDRTSREMIDFFGAPLPPLR